MDWMIVLSLIGVGLLLLVIEVVFIPGTSIAGFIGFALMVTGVVLSFSYFGSSTGWMLTGGTSVISAIVFIWVFRAKPWKKFALNSTISSRVNEGIYANLMVGDEGKTISMLRPRGKAAFGDKTVEVSSLGPFVEAGKRIKIINISSNQIFIEPLN